MRFQREKGVALITVLLVLFLVSAIVVGMSWMVMTDQRLGGNNLTRESAFYGAEAGMEKLTADLGNTYATKGAVLSSDITTAEADFPLIPNIQFQDSKGVSTYQVMCGASPCVACASPPSSTLQIKPPSPYSGMNATDYFADVASGGADQSPPERRSSSRGRFSSWPSPSFNSEYFPRRTWHSSTVPQWISGPHSHQRKPLVGPAKSGQAEPP